MIKNKKLKTLLQYLKTCDNNKEIFYFTDPTDAYNYGHSIRDNIEIENITDKIVVDISGNIVRIKIIAEELAYAGSGCDK